MRLSASLSNPFHGNVMDDPWKSVVVDVPRIHGPVFEQCREAVEHVRTHGESAGLVIHGRPGSGKTHLLSRLRELLARSEPTLDLNGPCQLFVSVRLATHPRYLWRHVRQRFADDVLRRGPDGFSQLEHVLAIRLARREGMTGDVTSWWSEIRRKQPQHLEDLLVDLADEDGIGHHDLLTVLGHLIRGRHRLKARSWLRGDSLPEQTVEQLKLAKPDVEADEPGALEQQAREVLISLCKLAGARTPVVFCFDQVEALQRVSSDATDFSPFGELVSELHDQAGNCVLISCIQSSYFQDLKDGVAAYARDRMTSYATPALQQLRFEESAELVVARLDASRELKPLRRGQPDRLWPLNDEDVRQAVGETGCTPRELIAHCANRFAERQGRPVSVPDVPRDVLPQLWQERVEAALHENASEQSEAILAAGLPILLEVTDPEWTVTGDESLRDIDLVLKAPQQEARVGVSFCTQRNMTSLAARLRRLRDQFLKSNLHKLVLLRDARSPISQTARKAREYLRDLETQDAGLYRPSAETLAALDALRKILADADSGDLAAAGKTIQARTVQEWLQRHLDESLRDLAQALVGYPQPVDFQDDDLDQLIEMLDRRHVMPLEQAASELNTSPDDLDAALRRNPHRLGYLQGPPGVIFERVVSGATDEA